MQRDHYFFYERRRGEPGNRVFAVGDFVGTQETAIAIAKAINRTSNAERIEAWRGTKKSGVFLGWADDA